MGLYNSDRKCVLCTEVFFAEDQAPAGTRSVAKKKMDKTNLPNAMLGKSSPHAVQLAEEDI